MKKKTDSKPGLLPPEQLVQRLSAWRKDFVLRGRSLVFLRSGLPVVVLEIPEEAFASLSATSLDQLPPELGARSIDTNGSEVKVILGFDSLPLRNSEVDGGFHCLIYAAGNALPASVSIERLRLPLGASAWQGSTEDLADLEAERLNWLADSEPDTRACVELCAMAAQLDFEPAERLKTQMYLGFRIEQAAELSRRFMRKQFRRILLGARPSRGFLCLDAAGALDWFLPELAAGRGLSQNRYHKYDIFYHSIYACDGVKEPDLVLRMAALFHDLGKVDTRKVGAGGEASFHNHEMVSSRHTANITRRFGFDPAVAKRVRFLVRNHMFHYTSEWTDKAVRRFIRRVKPDLLDDLIRLRLADREGSGKRTELPRAIKELMRHIEEVRREEAELRVRDLALTGHDLKAMGVEPGPIMGRILNLLLEQVRAEEVPNEHEALAGAARQLLSQEAGDRPAVVS